MEGKIALAECIYNPEFCARAASCSASTIWAGLNRNIRKQFEEVTLKDLMGMKQPQPACN